MEYLHNIAIKPEDIDELGHVNNTVYLRWVQEVAIAHWNKVATDEMKLQNVWVVTRHEIDYLHACFLDTKLIAKTWVGNSEGAKSERFVDLIDSENNKVMTKVKTTWFLLDAKTKRPKRVGKEFVDLFR